jgi:hypothetical protein
LYQLNKIEDDSKMVVLGNLLMAILEDFGPSIRTAFFSIIFCLSIASHARAEDVAADQEQQEHLYAFEAIKSRILNGPGALSTADKVIYFVVIALGFEVFNYVAINLGGRFWFCYMEEMNVNLKR